MIHEYGGDAFCIVPINGVPCLGEPGNETIHVQPWGGNGLSKEEQLSWMQIRQPESWPWILVRDRSVFRRYAVEAFDSLEMAREILQATSDRMTGERFWIEKR